MKTDVYLNPGQEFVYDQRGVKTRNFKLRNNQAGDHVINDNQRRDNPLISPDDKGTWYMFNNQSLDEALQQLAAFYNVRIVYNKKDIKNIYLTAKYSKFESIETILQRIGTLNKLTITKNDSAFTISK